jgi:deoxyhypusine synthase
MTNRCSRRDKPRTESQFFSQRAMVASQLCAPSGASPAEAFEWSHVEYRAQVLVATQLCAPSGASPAEAFEWSQVEYRAQVLVASQLCAPSGTSPAEACEWSKVEYSLHNVGSRSTVRSVRGKPGGSM